jgi:LmbE family N-acetylglucosaminyl deacetylase
MVMSGSDERVVFICAAPGDESLVVGGTVARLRSENATVVLLFESAGDAPGAHASSVRLVGADVSHADAPAVDASSAAAAGADRSGAHLSSPERRAELNAALAELDVSDWRMLPTASVAREEPDALTSAVRAVLAEMRANALVVGTASDVLQDAAVVAAGAAGVPVYLSRRVFEGPAQRMFSIDVSDQVETKARATAAYASRWRVHEHSVTQLDGSLLAITGTEAYLRVQSRRAPAESADEPPTPAARLLTSIFALLVGVAFGVLGTVGHQSTVTIGALVLPLGLIVASLGAAALLVGLRLVLGDRLIVLLAALGMLGTIFVLSLRSAGGSVLIPAGLTGTLWTLVPALIAVFVVAWPKLPPRR